MYDIVFRELVSDSVWFLTVSFPHRKQCLFSLQYLRFELGLFEQFEVVELSNVGKQLSEK